eukprot:comp33289_c0_seq1/m.47280 comp33289_c0_seq1/g.47280  ORF comp33289_c0_seq1/g.47280 comp33289_c0_seq1/m.47280 type:complete len:237 (-) comp33289_c0_seq1:327-1037(-)
MLLKAIHTGDVLAFLDRCPSPVYDKSNCSSPATLTHPESNNRAQLQLEDTKSHVRREITVFKPSNTPFGLTLTRLEGMSVVTSVLRGSPAWRAGVCEGDCIEWVQEMDLGRGCNVYMETVYEVLFATDYAEIGVREAAALHTVTITKKHTRGCTPSPLRESGFRIKGGVVESSRLSATDTNISLNGMHVYRVDDKVVAGMTDVRIEGMAEQAMFRNGEVTVYFCADKLLEATVALR